MTPSPHSITLLTAPDAAAAVRAAFLLANPTAPTDDEPYIEDLLDCIHEERLNTENEHSSVLQSDLSITTDAETWHRALTSARKILEANNSPQEADALRTAYVRLHSATDGRVYAARMLLAYERHAPNFAAIAQWLNERTEMGENMERATRDFAPPAANSPEFPGYAPPRARHAAERLAKLADRANTDAQRQIAQSVFLIGFDQCQALFSVKTDAKTDYRAEPWERFAEAASQATAEYISPHNHSAAEYIQMMTGETRLIVAS